MDQAVVVLPEVPRLVPLVVQLKVALPQQALPQQVLVVLAAISALAVIRLVLLLVPAIAVLAVLAVALVLRLAAISALYWVQQRMMKWKVLAHWPRPAVRLLPQVDPCRTYS